MDAASLARITGRPVLGVVSLTWLDRYKVARVFERCGNVWGGLGARDPWRFVSNPLTAADGVLLPGWKALLLKYPEMFMVGSDPVWPV